MQLIWEEFLKIIKEEAGSQVVETWFKAVVLQHWDSEKKTVFLKTPNVFVKNWIKNHYINLIKTHLSRLLNVAEINVELTNNFQSEEIKPQLHKKDFIPASALKNNNYAQVINLPTVIPNHSTSTALQKTKLDFSNLNENYTFDSFVVGPNNSLAHAAAYAITKSLGTVYNPLFIYGGTGLGKTHLLHSIGNEVRKNNVDAKIYYETSDKFINDFINSIRFDRTNRFRQKYQKLDLFLLDDIQFFSNKEQTQEMFFHIFNTLFEQKKQIIFSSDTFPQEITGLQSRLKSRLESGLVADIQTPDLETKIAILKKKAILHSILINDEVAEFIASRVLSNIRELEGALIRVGAFSSLTNQKLTLELAQKVLINIKDINNSKNGAQEAQLQKVLKVLAKTYCLSVNDLKSHKRQKDIAATRQIAFYLMKKTTYLSLKTIGDFIGGRDHSTVIHAITKVEKQLESDSSFAKKLKLLEEEVLAS
ncbi:MAG: chromosomal replication initiator protein DnaA [bacterium]